MLSVRRRAHAGACGAAGGGACGRMHDLPGRAQRAASVSVHAQSLAQAVATRLVAERLDRVHSALAHALCGLAVLLAPAGGARGDQRELS